MPSHCISASRSNVFLHYTPVWLAGTILSCQPQVGHCTSRSTFNCTAVIVPYTQLSVTEYVSVWIPVKTVLVYHWTITSNSLTKPDYLVFAAAGKPLLSLCTTFCTKIITHQGTQPYLVICLSCTVGGASLRECSIKCRISMVQR